MSGLSGNLGPLLRCEFVRPRSPALESTFTPQRDGGRVPRVLGLGLVLVGAVRDDGRGEAVEIYGALA